MTDAGLADVVIAINLSPSELGGYAIADVFRSIISTHGIHPGRLEVEMTEDAFAAADNALAILAELSELGVRIAIDDFGTGYSSIAYLRTMRVDRIKIDRCFVIGFDTRPADRILVQAILGLGRSFGIEVLAEGVETDGEAALLRSLGCGSVQGFRFGRPMESAELAAWMKDHSGKGQHPQDTAPGVAAPLPRQRTA